MDYQELVELDKTLWLIERNCRGYAKMCDREECLAWWRMITGSADESELALLNIVGPGRRAEKTPERAILFTGEAWEVVITKLASIMKMSW